MGDAGLDGRDDEETNEKTSERRGDFKRGDLYKMHAYRDAIPAARSVWILYPGGEFRFFDASGDESVATSPEELPESICGVGAIPFAPRAGSGLTGSPHATARALLWRLLDSRPT